MEDNKILKELIQKRRYQECIDILKAKIIDYVVDLINDKGIEYEYTNIIDLIQLSECYIDDERKNIAKNLKYFSFNEDKILCIDRLLEICRLYNIR